jgi:hypothetical protein
MHTTRGFAAVDDNGIHVATVSPTEIGAMVNAMATIMGLPLAQIPDEEVRQLWAKGAGAFGLRIEPVRINTR